MAGCICEFRVCFLNIPETNSGHAQTSTTTNIYSHVIRTADEKAAEVIVDAFVVKKTMNIDDA